MTKRPPALLERARLAEQRGNREGRDLWDRYAVHRAHVTDAILALAPASGGRVCLLGAGNANDLDLERLAARWGEVHLVDIDPTALSRAVGRQPAEVRAKLRLHAPVDLSGLYQQLESRGPKRDLVTTGVAEVLAKLPGDFDLAVSGCVLSQMSWALQELADEGELPQAVLEQALLRIHLRTLLGLVRPGQPTLLVADLVSSDAYPFDELTPGTDLRALVEHLSEERIAYPVCNLALIKQILRKDEVLTAEGEPPQMGQPWLWTGRHDRTYLVYPLVLRRRARH